MSRRATLVRLAVGSVLAGGLALTGSGVALADTPSSGTSSAVPMNYSPDHEREQAEYREGYRDGYRQGFQDGKKDCRDDDEEYFTHVEPDAYTEGFQAGYSAGYDKGCAFQEARNNGDDRY
jgi:hypothetical protein